MLHRWNRCEAWGIAAKGLLWVFPLLIKRARRNLSLRARSTATQDRVNALLSFGYALLIKTVPPLQAVLALILPWDICMRNDLGDCAWRSI